MVTVMMFFCVCYSSFKRSLIIFSTNDCVVQHCNVLYNCNTAKSSTPKMITEYYYFIFLGIFIYPG